METVSSRWSMHRPRRPLVVAAISFLLAASVAAALIWRVEEYRQQETRLIAFNEATSYALSFERNIQQSLTASYALAGLVREGKGSVATFKEATAEMLPLYPAVSELALAPAGVIRSVAPLVGNEKALSFDLLHDPAQKAEAMLARESGKLTLAGPLDLVQGGVGIVGRLPVFLHDSKEKPRFWGFTLVVVPVSELLRIAGVSELTKHGYAYELWRIHPADGKKQVIATSSSSALLEPVSQSFSVPNTTWTLSVMPVKGWGDPLGLSFMAALGVLFSLLIAFISKLMVEAQIHANDLEVLVAQRTAEVKEREADLNRAQSVARIGSWVLDPGANDLKWSAEGYRIFGASGQALPDHKAVLQHVYSGDRDAVDHAWQGLLNGERYDIEYRILAGAEMRWVHAQADAQLTPEGKLQRCVGTVQDVSERKRAEAQLRAAEEQFRGLVEQEIAGIYIIQDGKILYANPRAAEIVGQGSADEIVGGDPLLLVSEPDRGKVAESIRQLLSGEVMRTELEFDVLRRDGVTIQVGANAARATHQGRSAVIGVLQDVSEKKRAEEEIRRYFDQLNITFMSTVEVATTLSEMRDPYTAGHERRVAAIAVAIGAELGFDERRQKGLRVAGFLHDIGKISVPAEILAKPGRLNEGEFMLIRGHCQASYEVLKGVEFPWPVAQIALQHHERLDGSGYPQGLKGDEILLEARILSVADVVEAMSSHRPYRPGLGIDMALAELERGSGTLYDSTVASTCLKLFREKGYMLPS